MGFGPSGFLGAPVSKLICYGTGIASLATHLLRLYSSKLALTPKAIQGTQLWRLLTSNFVFTTPGEAIFGIYLLYHFRVFERLQGSRKYGTFLAVCTTLSTGLQLALMPIVRAVGRSAPLMREPFAPGPLAIIFAQFVPFFMDIPCTYHFTVFGIRFSNKAFVYLAGLQVFLAHATRTALPSTCGMIASVLFHMNVLGIRTITPPRSLCLLLSKAFGPLLGTNASPRPLVRMRPSNQQGRQQRQARPGAAGGPGAGATGGGDMHTAQAQAQAQAQMAAAGLAEALGGQRGPTRHGQGADGMGDMGMGDGDTNGAMRPVPPPPEAVETLVSMGFDEAAARRALAMGDNNVTVATNILLEGS